MRIRPLDLHVFAAPICTSSLNFYIHQQIIRFSSDFFYGRAGALITVSMVRITRYR